MKERPILFSAPMVRALLAGTKTQTRRIVKPQPQGGWSSGDHGCSCDARENVGPCPYGKAGDRLWVKETWKADQIWDDFRPLDIPEGEAILYTADEHATRIIPFGWGRGRPSIFMRRWMSRITLELTSVRVERLNDISEGAARDEGCVFDGAYWHGHEGMAAFHSSYGAYADLWESINGPGSWATNPWVWVLSFRRVSA